MKKQITSIDIQRKIFIDKLYQDLHRKTASAIKEYKKIYHQASLYLQDGLEQSEAIELLILDGVSRDVAMKYVAMANDSAYNETVDNSDTVDNSETKWGFKYISDKDDKEYSSVQNSKIYPVDGEDEHEAICNAIDKYVGNPDYDIFEILEVFPLN